MLITKLTRLVFGNLYPAYASYKAVKTKNVKEYVKWMMYWIVFALFTCTETFTDIFLSWFPFYYEIKIILVIWLLSPATRGSSFLYRKFVHPMLSRREQEIDEYINRAKEQSYRQVLDLGQKGVTVLMQTAIKGGGGIVNQLKKSYSLSDLTGIGNEMIRVSQNDRDELDDNVSDIRVVRRRMQRDKRSPHRSSSASAAGVYFSEVDINVLTTGSIIGDNQLGEIRSTEDISSGYSSGEFSHQSLKMQSKEGVHRSASMKTRPTRVTRSSSRSNVPKKTSPSISDESDDDEVFDTNIVFFNDKAKHIQKLVDNYEKLSETESESEFFDTPDFSLLLSSPARHGKRNLRNVTACSVSKSEHSFQSVLPSVSDTKSSWNNSAKPLEKQICNLPDEAGPSTSKDTYLSDKEIRGGKYHKKMAPPPPAPAIKATLVLQPGVVKNLSKSAESLLDKQVFLRSSVPRKSRSKSPSSRNSSALQKLLKLPKKITNASGSLKRKSWSDFFAGKMISGTKRQSKSTSNLENYTENPVLVKVPSQQSLVSVRSMTESPLAHRRLRIIRAYVDEDID